VAAYEPRNLRSVFAGKEHYYRAGYHDVIITKEAPNYRLEQG